MSRLRTLVISTLACLLALPTARPDLPPAEMKKWKQEMAERRASDSAAFSEMMRAVDALEVFILNPSSTPPDRPATKGAKDGTLAGWKIVQRLHTTKRSEIESLVAGLKLSIDSGPDGVTPCFEPRHGLRFSKDGKEVIVLVCFQCIGMEVQGYPPFGGAAISHASEKDFYLLFRAHGEARQNRLAGMNDREIAKRLAGKWRSKGRTDGGSSGLEVVFEEIETFAANGNFHSQGTLSLAKPNEAPAKFRDTSSKGTWRIQDGMLVLSGLDPEQVAASALVESWSPVVEVLPDRIVLGSLLPNSDKEHVIERVP